MKKRRKKLWIKGAIKHPGRLTRAAKRAGMSIPKYCAKKNLSTSMKRACALAKRLKKMTKRGRK